MYKYIVSVFWFVFVWFNAICQPIASFDKKQIDFGTVTEGTLCKYSFKFKNTGNKPLIIYDVKVTCGCTAPRWVSPIAPGDTSSIYVEFNTSFKQGYVAKGINLIVNANDPEVNLVVLANIVPDSTFKVITDSTNFKPLKIITKKMVYQIVIPLENLSKKGLKGDVEKAENLVKYILRNENSNLLGSIWYSSTSDYVEINTFSLEYKNLLASKLSKNLSKKRKLKRLQKKARKANFL
ncbi:MAG: DUF1573 domain-containing protein [Bacteroidetes bacterium]|nr:DUF1573 domain-containing protein [Bacteroidota bacterium]